MKLESLPKFYSPKSPKLSDSSPATGGDALTITDVMAAQGMVQALAPMGFNLFLGKMGIQDPEPAISALAQHAQTLRNTVLRKLGEDDLQLVARYLAEFSYSDYARSAANKCECPYCAGEGVLRVNRDVVKHPGVKGVEAKIKEEAVEELCAHCNGKGEISTACRDCHGRGKVLDKKRSELHGVPVEKLCDRCRGKGCSRLPTTLARRYVERIVPEMTNYQWYSGYAHVIDILVTKCWQEEAFAELKLREVTR